MSHDAEYVITSCRNAAIPAQKMQRTGMRERARGSGTGQNPLAERAPRPATSRSIARRRGEARVT
jgi:hypothetical protein